MKLLVMDTDGEGMGVDFALRAKESGHYVRYWLPKETSGERPLYGDGLLDRPDEWEPSMDWAELIVTTGNSTYAGALAPYFGKGYPIFGANQKSAALELDRGEGQAVLEYHGIETLPYEVVDSAEDAINFIVKAGKPYVMKPWGGDADKSMTCVPRDVDEAVFTLRKWEEDGKFKGQLMLQEKVDGVEMGVAGWFGPGGWNSAIEESFEHKKFLNDDLGENTGEMGTVLRHVERSKLFDAVLEPLTDYLHLVKYVGCCSVNCIIDDKGRPWPLEFTNRLGWPAFCITQEVVQGDPANWMLDLLKGIDSLDVSKHVAMGILMAHGDFPKCKDPQGTWARYPISGVSADNLSHLHFQQVMQGLSPMVVDGKVKDVDSLLTAGPYVMIVGGHGKTVRFAQDDVYELAGEIKWPGNLMYRTDIGNRLEKELPLVQKFGFADGLRY
jgi:phosphoribosylamine--glycine ligase